MTKLGGRPPLLLLTLAAVLALALAACGDDGDGGGAVKGTTGKVRQGGAVTISLSAQPDSLDPALSYTANGWEAMWLVWTPLLTYKHAPGAEGAKLIPGLAESLPEVSADGKTYRLRLRRGLTYSNGAPVRASDFEHTIRRVINLESGGTSFYAKIVGAEDYAEARKPEGDIEGIETDDRTGDITVRLAEPDGTFANVLAMNFAGLVPGDTPFKDLSKDPPPGVGPYAITRSEPNRQFVMERNRRFDVPGVPKGNVDRITAKIVKSLSRQAQDVIRGNLDYMQDPPPADMLPEIKQRYRDRYREAVTNSTYYFFLNQRVAPFDKPEVRQAVNYGVDKPALARLFGGLLEPGCNFLPPGMPGYRKVDPCPWGDPRGRPNVAKARQLVRQAGAEGEEVTVWGNTEEPTPQVTEAYADMLNKIGLKAKPKIVDGAVYLQTVGKQSTRAQTGFSNWFQDFPHPANFFFLVEGASIQPTNNQNWSNVDDPGIDAQIEKLRKEPNVEKVADQWADLDKKLVQSAYIAPFGHRKLTTFLSPRMNVEDCALFHALYQNDYSSWCLK